MDEERILSFDLPAVARKKVSVGFDGGMLSSDAGVLLLRGIERRFGLSKRLAATMPYRRPTFAQQASYDACAANILQGIVARELANRFKRASAENRNIKHVRAASISNDSATRIV